MADHFVLLCDSLPPSRVLAFRIGQRLSHPYRVQVYLDSVGEMGAMKAALGQPGTLLINEYPTHGVIIDVELKLAVDSRRVYRITLVPELERLSYTRHSRVFVEKSVVEVIEAILARNEVTDRELRLRGVYPTRRQITQYKETDLAFLHRWLEREGIYYYHLQNDSSATLIITDDKSRHDSAPNDAIRYHVGGRGAWEEGEALDRWRRVHRAGTASVQVRGYDFLKPALPISGTRREVAPGFEEVIRYEDNLQDPGDAQRIAAIRGQELVATAVRWHGTGNVRGLHEGLRFNVEEHPREAFNRCYQAIGVTHQGTVLRDDPDLECLLGLPRAKSVYRVEVEAISNDVQYRPQRVTPWPLVSGVESVIIDGELDSEYAQIDGEGRYRVRFRFDEAEKPNGSASAWVRMQQPHGGVAEGWHLPLRQGTEAVVAFVHGDPDRPYIAGAVPTPREPSPVTQSNSTQNVVQTGARNRVEIEDLEGEQYIDVCCPQQRSFVHLGVHAGLGDHNLAVSTTGDGLHHSGDKRDISVLGNQTETVAGDLTEEYCSNQATHVTGSFDETINSGMTQSISSGASQRIDGGLTQTIDGGETRTVNGDLNETIDGGRTQTIQGSSSESIGGTLNQSVSGSATIATPGSYEVTGSSSVSITTPAAASVTGLGGVKIVAPGGHMSVDSFYKGIGVVDNIDYALKWGGAGLKFTVNGTWLRQIGVHLAGYGLKVDFKVVEAKAGRHKKYGALNAEATGSKASQAILHMIDAPSAGTVVAAAGTAAKYGLAGAMGLGMVAVAAAPALTGTAKPGAGPNGPTGDPGGDSNNDGGVCGPDGGEGSDLQASPSAEPPTLERPNDQPTTESGQDMSQQPPRPPAKGDDSTQCLPGDAEQNPDGPRVAEEWHSSSAGDRNSSYGPLASDHSANHQPGASTPSPTPSRNRGGRRGPEDDR